MRPTILKRYLIKTDETRRFLMKSNFKRIMNFVESISIVKKAKSRNFDSVTKNELLVISNGYYLSCTFDTLNTRNIEQQRRLAL